MVSIIYHEEDLQCTKKFSYFLEMVPKYGFPGPGWNLIMTSKWGPQAPGQSLQSSMLRITKEYVKLQVQSRMLTS